MKKKETQKEALEYLRRFFPDLDENDQNGFIRGSFWTTVAKYMAGFAEEYALAVVRESVPSEQELREMSHEYKCAFGQVSVNYFWGVEKCKKLTISKAEKIVNTKTYI